MIKKYASIILFFYAICTQAQDFIEHPIGEVTGSFTSIRLNDFDNDGNMDVVGTINGSSQILAWFGSGDGDFENPTTIEGGSGVPARDIDFLDVNNDEKMDIVAVASVIINGIDFEMLVYYINNGDRTFENFVLVDPNVGSSINNFFSVFDVNNDNLDDIVIKRFFNSTMSIVYYPNTGNGSFGGAIEIIDNPSKEVFAQDFNNDNLVDIVLGNGAAPMLFINNGDATFTFNTAFNEYPTAQFATLIASGQLDNNQTPDIVMPNTNFTDTAGVIWYSNDGDANFTLQENITNPTIIGDTYTIARVTDFNNDGNNDLIAGVRFNSGVGIPFWINDGSSNFSPFIVETTSDDINHSLEVFDFNNDTKMDFIVGTDDGKLTWFENNMTLSVEDNSINTISITPNPSTGLYTIANTQNSELYTVHVYNALGQLVTIITHSNSIDLSAQPNGVYIAKIKNQSGTNAISKKLIKL
ncbi:MAG: hypothetical protein ACI828_002170 [Flavobacteriales bacterium]|jgi:hypothetical protein